mmetsp:Transcript_8258/g.4402  ORF Transcript_8258/g.4402 Transcript_8258/m.4402 type:complete len:140 (+) Transcript_8258:2246-2665(+)
MKQAPEIVKLILDGVLILTYGNLHPIEMCVKQIKKENYEFIKDSFEPYAKSMITDSGFLKKLIDFSVQEKDKINDETCELLEPYLSLEPFTATVAKVASAAAEGLCTWVRAMRDYHEASKIVKPKMEFLAIQESRLNAA